MFFPKSNIPYKFVFKEIQNNTIVYSSMILTFTGKNELYKNEFRNGFDHHECYDIHGYRFICYLDNNYCFLNSEDTNNGKIMSFDITKVYLDDEIVFTS